LSRTAFSLRSILALSLKYDASREAVARRMVTLGGRTSALILFSKRLKPVETRLAGVFIPKMRVLYSAYSEDFPLYFPEHKSVPEDSCVNRVEIIDQVKQVFEDWDFGGLGLCEVEAMALPVPDCSDATAPTVMALLQLPL
jgi:hypothetical protein